MSTEIPADLTPLRLFQHVKNLQSQVNTLAAICSELKASMRKCGECKLLKDVKLFHEKSSVCKPCKRKVDRGYYLARKKR